MMSLFKGHGMSLSLGDLLVDEVKESTSACYTAFCGLLLLLVLH